MAIKGQAGSTLEGQLREALAHSTLFLEYQPIVSVPGHEVVGAEALLRWNSAHGVRFPNAFVPMIEHSNLLSSIGYWVVVRATRQVAKWREETGKDLRVYVNVSPHQFYEPGFLTKIHEILATTNFPSNRLTLEITEHSPLSRQSLTGEKVRLVQDGGVHVALDDFGTGYNTIEALQAIQADTVKIDQAIVVDVLRHEWSAQIVEVMIRAGRTLGLQQVVEGVETLEHSALIESFGPDFAQGFYYGRPALPDDFERLYLT
jgi:EAL domain-containing protein (putative c-di-GMP-specific phosphodiesterase class I)